MSHFPNYKQWRDAIEKMTPEDVLAGELPSDTPVYAKILLEKLRGKFSGLTPEQLSACREAIVMYRQKVEEAERNQINWLSTNRIERCEDAKNRGIQRAEEEAYSARLSELGIPSFVVPDGPDAPAKLLCLANMPKRERIRYIKNAMAGQKDCPEDGCSECKYEKLDEDNCVYCSLDSHVSLCLSEWKWIQREAQRYMQSNEDKDE